MPRFIAPACTGPLLLSHTALSFSKNHIVSCNGRAISSSCLNTFGDPSSFDSRLSLTWTHCITIFEVHTNIATDSRYEMPKGTPKMSAKYNEKYSRGITTWSMKKYCVSFSSTGCRGRGAMFSRYARGARSFGVEGVGGDCRSDTTRGYSFLG